jgi:hypothetical protein
MKNDNLDRRVALFNNKGEFYAQDEYGEIVGRIDKVEKDGRISYVVHGSNGVHTYTPEELSVVMDRWRMEPIF